MVLEYLADLGVEVRYRGRGKNETTHYCNQCEVRSLEPNALHYIREGFTWSRWTCLAVLGMDYE
jgi:hypothetical protein